MVLTLGLQVPRRLVPVTRRSVAVRSSYVPDYSSPDPSDLPRYFAIRGSEEEEEEMPMRKFW